MGLSFLPLLAGCTLCCVTLPPPPPLQGKEGGRAGANFMPFSLPLFSPFFSPRGRKLRGGGGGGRRERADFLGVCGVCVCSVYGLALGLLFDYFLPPLFSAN